MTSHTNLVDDIRKIIDAPATDSSDIYLTLFGLVVSLNAQTIVELGVRDGGTTLPLLMGAYLTGGTVHSVDIHSTEFTPSSTYSSRWTFYPQDAIEFLTEWPVDKTIDILYIDDWHSYEHVKKELEIVDRLVGPSSIIIIHDTMYGNTQPYYHADLTLQTGQWAGGGPYRAIAELDPNFWEFSTIPVKHGLTILRKKYSNKYNHK